MRASASRATKTKFPDLTAEERRALRIRAQECLTILDELCERVNPDSAVCEFWRTELKGIERRLGEAVSSVT